MKHGNCLRRVSCHVCAWLVLGCSVSCAGLAPVEVHVDVVSSYDSGVWKLEYVYREVGGVGEERRPLTDAFLKVPDRFWESGSGNDGARVTRPAGTEWDFLGVEEGEPFWWLTQSDNNICWPGFASAQTGVMASYDDPDPRTFGTLPYVTVTLLDVRYEGAGETGQFSLWQGFGASQTIWMNANGTGGTPAEKGIESSDKFILLEGGHDHANWAFSDLGLYFLEVQASGFLASSPATRVTSDSGTIVAAVGTFAIWQATQFDFAQLSDSTVSGPEGDPDHDERNNLVEYALGTDPNQPDHVEWSGSIDAGRLKLGFKRRTAASNPQVEYLAKFGPDLQVATWQEANSESATALEEGWESVEAADPVSGAARRFGRVEFKLQDAIPYP